MSKRIVFFMSSMGRGGAERVVSILSHHYCNVGWKLDICMLLHNIKEYPLDERVSVIDMSFEACHHPLLRRMKMLMAIRKYIKDKKPDVVVPFLAKTSALVDIALIGAGKRRYRLVASERIDPYSVNYSRLLRLAINHSFSKADTVVFQTQKAKSFYSADIQAKSVVIRNPVSMCIERKNPTEHVIINAGRLEPQKNQKLLIDAFSRISEKHPSYEMHIYGDGILRVELERQIAENRLEERIYLMGSRADYLESLSKCEIFVLSSNFEGLSNALLEAMILGIPCISTDCAGSDEVIKDRKNGMLVPRGDMEALSNALDELISDSGLRKTLGANGRASLECIRTDKIIEAWEKAFVSGES